MNYFTATLNRDGTPHYLYIETRWLDSPDLLTYTAYGKIQSWLVSAYIIFINLINQRLVSGRDGRFFILFFCQHSNREILLIFVPAGGLLWLAGQVSPELAPTIWFPDISLNSWKRFRRYLLYENRWCKNKLNRDNGGQLRHFDK